MASSCLAPGGDYEKTWEILSDPRPIGTAFVERGEPMIRENLSFQKMEGTPISPDPWKEQSLWVRSYILSNMGGVRISIKEIFLPQLMEFLR
jgi:chorismate-pyruvate lyase